MHLQARNVTKHVQVWQRVVFFPVQHSKKLYLYSSVQVHFRHPSASQFHLCSSRCPREGSLHTPFQRDTLVVTVPLKRGYCCTMPARLLCSPVNRATACVWARCWEVKIQECCRVHTSVHTDALIFPNTKELNLPVWLKWS